MTDIKFSIYGDQPSPLEDPAFLLDDFQKQQGARVMVERMPWGPAWPKLLDYALYGGGPHISHVGAVWTSTLVAMNVLRPFKAPEIAALGGTGAFPAAAWQNAVLTGLAGQAWAIPFSLYTYLVWYRRDLLQRAGVAEETAFASAPALHQTVEQLQAAGVESPLLLPSGKSCRPRVHMSASWVWGAGGDFVSPDHEQLTFSQPSALAGLADFFSLYRLLAPADYDLSLDQCEQRFAAGHAALLLGGSGALGAFKHANNPQLLENLGVAVMPGVPWIGGANLVIWRETQSRLDAERLSLMLTKYLTALPAQVKYAQAQQTIPARLEAVPQVDFGLALFQAAVSQTLQRGRAYQPLPMWMRVVNELYPTFDTITAKVLAQPALSPGELLQQYIPPLAHRFNLMLGA